MTGKKMSLGNCALPDMLQVAGWGHTEYQGQGSSSLQSVGLEMVAREQCREAFSRQQDITDRMLCAGTQRGGKDACQVNWLCCIAVVLNCTVGRQWWGSGGPG